MFAMNKETEKKSVNLHEAAVSKPQSAIWQRMTSLGLVNYLAKIFDQL